MATVAGIRDVQFFRQERVWNRKTVVATRMPLHIHRDRHVTADAIAAAFMLMVDWINFWRFGEAAIVTAHTEVISLQRILVGMRIVAVQANHPVLIHLAAEKRFKLVILVLDLTVRIPASITVQSFQRIMVIKRIAGLKILGQVDVAGMAGTTKTNDAGWLQF